MTATTSATAPGRLGSARVIARGESGRLFYESFAAEATDIAQAARNPLFPIPIAIRWKRLIETRGRLLKLRGLRLYILIAPDAHFIYRDEVPPHIALPVRSPARQFVDLFDGIDNVTIINPEKALIAARGGIDVYKANDTHWSAYGAFIAYQQLTQRLSPGTPMRPVTADDITYRLQASFGDLGALVDPEVRVKIPVATVRNGASRLQQDLAGEGRNAWKRFTCAHGRGSAFISRDSFATELGAFANETFARTDWIGGTSRLHLEAIDEEKPDTVIWQIAERRLHHVEHDHHSKTAYEIYAFDRSTPFGKHALDAYADQVEGRLTNAVAHARAAVHHPEAGPPYLYLLAELLEANGELEEAEAVVRRAIALQDNRPAYWHLLSIISRRRGDMGRALAASRECVDLFRHNAQFVADHGYNLLALGQDRDAIDLMQRCRDLVSDSPHLSYWLAKAYLRVGDVQSARAEAINAYLLLPQHSEIFELAWTIEDHCGHAPKRNSAVDSASTCAKPRSGMQGEVPRAVPGGAWETKATEAAL